MGNMLAGLLQNNVNKYFGINLWINIHFQNTSLHTTCIDAAYQPQYKHLYRCMWISASSRSDKSRSCCVSQYSVTCEPLSLETRNTITCRIECKIKYNISDRWVIRLCGVQDRNATSIYCDLCTPLHTWNSLTLYTHNTIDCRVEWKNNFIVFALSLVM